MHGLDIISKIVVLGSYIDIGHITTLSSRKYDFFPKRSVFFKYDFIQIFRRKYTTEESSSTSSDYNYVVHKGFFIGRKLYLKYTKRDYKYFL
jgi:hypothetical protein